MAEIVEVIKFEGDLSDLKKDLKTAESAFSNLETKGKVAAKNTEKSFSQLGNSVKGVIQNLPFGYLVDDLESAGEAAKNLGGNISNIQGSAGKAGTGIKALTGLVGIGLLGAFTLVIAAIGSVVAFLKQTDEGAAKLEATFAGVGAATDVLSGKLAQAGSAIVDFFSESNTLSDALGTTLKAAINALIPGAGLLGTLIGESGLAKEMTSAYDAAYELSIQLDAIQDEMRLLGVESKQTDLIIQALLKQAKNRGTEVTARLDIIKEAQELENANLQKNFELQKRYYDNITQSNINLLATKNSLNAVQVAQVRVFTDQIKGAKNADELLTLYRKQVEAQNGLLSISDELAQVQVNGLEKIIELDGRSQVLSEKYANIQSQLIEQDITERTNAIKAVERAREASAINQIKGEQELKTATLEIQLQSLNAQRALLASYGRDVSQIDLDIANLNKKYQDEITKVQADALAKRLAQEKAYSEAQRKLQEENYQKTIQDQDENLKFQTLQIRNQSKSAEEIQKDELKAQIGNLEAKRIINEENGRSTLDIELELQAKKKQLYDSDVKDYTAAQAKKKQATLQALDFVSSITTEVFNGLAQNQSARTQVELQESQQASQLKQQQLQQQLDQGLISQEKYSASLKLVQAKQLAYENGLKARQAKADKQAALFNIVINTAASIAKTLATLGVPAGIPASLIAAASGAAQFAIVNARPVPKYKDGVIDLKGKGTGTSDSIDAKLSKGESVMTAKETGDNLGLLWAIRKNKLDDYVNRAWVAPALDKYDQVKKQKEKRYNNMMKRAVSGNKELDTLNLERAIKRNKGVRIENWSDMPDKGGRKIV